MTPEQILDFVRTHAEPLPTDEPERKRYRVAGTLTDGTALPCIVVQSIDARIDMAIRRFGQTKDSQDPTMGYRSIVGVFTASGNSVNSYDLHSLAQSRHAIPFARVLEIGGETRMAWTEFYATMSDGREFRFATQFHTDFFDMPDGYSATNIINIVPAIDGEPPRQERLFREKPFFNCYIPGI